MSLFLRLVCEAHVRGVSVLPDGKGISVVGIARAQWWQQLLLLHRAPRSGGWHVVGDKADRTLGLAGDASLNVMRKRGVAKCPLGSLGECLLVDLAELSFHACIRTEHSEVCLSQTIHSALLLHMDEFLTASKS